DGFVVARSPEAKALDIAMGYPWFKLEAIADQYNLVARSSNYELYGEMSSRVMNHRLLHEMQLAIILSRFSAWLEVIVLMKRFLVYGAASMSCMPLVMRSNVKY